MSWSSDGKILLACSMDGSVAAVILSAKEIGTAISDSKLYDILRERYGKNFGTIANLKTSNVTNGNGPVVIENPDMLKSDNMPSNMPSTNGHDSISRNSFSSSKPRLHPQGPTDKQIEARTSDGRRRITPIFIPMSSMENGGGGPATNGGATASMFGITEFGSSSTQERSKINIEKRNDIVKPNVSPNKCNSSEALTTEPTVKKKEEQPKAEPKPEPKVNVLQAKKKPTAGTTTTANQKTNKEPPVNIIQVKKKPSQPTSSSQSSTKNATEISPSKKRKRIAVLSDSSSDEDMDTSQSNSMKSEEKKPAAAMASSTGTTEDPTKGTKLKEAKVKKPDLMTSKSSLEVSPKRPRGRPPLNREYSTEPKTSPPQPSTSSVVSSTMAKDNQQGVQKQKTESVVAAPRFKMPSLKMDKCKVYNFTMRDQEKINISVNNNLVPSKLHEVKCQSTKYNWTALLSSHVVTVGTSQEVIVVVCKNGSLHMFSPGDRGQRLFPPLQLPSSVSKLTFESNQLAIVTTCGHLFIWTLDPRPKIKVPKENIQSLVQSDDSESSYVTKILMKPELILVTSKGRAFSYSEALGSWLCLSDTSSTIQSCSSFATSATNLPAETANLPLASIGKDFIFHQIESIDRLFYFSGYLTPTQPPTGRLQNSVPNETKILASITHCRNQRLAAEYLQSPKEYQYWLIAEVKQMAADGDMDGIRNCFDWLMGPVHASASAKKELMLGCLDKQDLLKSCLVAIKGNLHLQRIYIEYNDQINASDQVADIDMLLHV